MSEGLYKKYLIEKADGTPVDASAQYFVLRIDADVHARRALRTYAESVKGGNVRLARELRAWLIDTRDTVAGREEAASGLGGAEETEDKLSSMRMQGDWQEKQL